MSLTYVCICDSCDAKAMEKDRQDSEWHRLQFFKPGSLDQHKEWDLCPTCSTDVRALLENCKDLT